MTCIATTTCLAPTHFSLFFLHEYGPVSNSLDLQKRWGWGCFEFSVKKKPHTLLHVRSLYVNKLVRARRMQPGQATRWPANQTARE